MVTDHPVVEFRSVSKSFGGVRALDHVDLIVASRATVVLIGPSGCGKSTILRLIAGLVRPDEGKVVLEGGDLTSDRLAAVRLRLGYVIQEGGLFPHLDTRANVTLMAHHLGWPSARINARVSELCELTRIPEAILARFPVELSGGQRQRVSLMRALMLDPDVLLLDEPLGALDPMIRAELQDDLRRIFRALGKTVLLVTHDLAEAGFFADRIVLLRDGRVIQDGRFDDLLRSPSDSFVSRFVTAQRSHAAALTGAA